MKVHETSQQYESSQLFITTHASNGMLLFQGKMQWLWDSNNKRYLDLFGGIVTVGVGHCHP